MPNLHVLDTSSPVQVYRTLELLAPESTFVIVASKSGTTIEPLSLYAIVRDWLDAAMPHPQAGRHCVAITDQGTPLEKLRQRDVMRVALSAPPTVGGRYSALTMFGLAPAALIGAELPVLVERAALMEALCGEPAENNPAALLAAWMADAHSEGRDKLVLACSRSVRPFALWIEQLVAESLGKDGLGIVPVIEHDTLSAPAYGDDVAVVTLWTPGDAALSEWKAALESAHPVFEIAMSSPLDIAPEFVRWEHAVALTGVLLGVNPFDEPNVAEAKKATTRILEEGGAADVPSATADIDGTWVTYAGGLEPPVSVPKDVASAIAHAISSLGERDYLALLVFAPDDAEALAPLEQAAARVSRALGRPVSLQLGPRYLHSTGQLHKGGPNSGVFIVVTGRDPIDIEIPGRKFGLRALHRAQAEGDLVTLASRGRRVMRLDLPSADAVSLAALAADLEAAAGA
jgi:hypothetical protein